MKKSKDWVRKPDLEKRLDQLVDEGGHAVEELTAYQAAKALNLSDGGEFYRTFRIWKEGRIAKSEARLFEVPPEYQEAIQRIAVNVTESVTDQFMHTARKMGGEIDSAARRRIEDAESRAEKRVAHALREVEEMNDRWCEAEAGRDEAISRAEELEVRLQEAQECQYQLWGRIEQLLRDRQEQAAAPPAPPVSPEPENSNYLQIPSEVTAREVFPVDHERNSGADNEFDRGSDDPASPTNHAPRDDAGNKAVGN